MRYVLAFPPDTVILSRRRRILVHGTYEANTIKYRSAGRLPFGSQDSRGYHFRLAASYTLSRFAGLPLKGKQVVTCLTFISYIVKSILEISHLRWLSPFGAYGTTFLHRKASHTILRSLTLPYESCSLATPDGGTMDAKQCAT